MNNSIKYLEEIFKIYPELSQNFIEYLYVKNKSSLLDILVSNDENRNIIYKNLIVICIHSNLIYRGKEVEVYLEKEGSDVEVGDIPIVIQFLDYLFDLIPTEMSKNWQRVCAYCEVRIAL